MATSEIETFFGVLSSGVVSFPRDVSSKEAALVSSEPWQILIGLDLVSFDLIILKAREKLNGLRHHFDSHRHLRRICSVGLGSSISGLEVGCDSNCDFSTILRWRKEDVAALLSHQIPARKLPEDQSGDGVRESWVLDLASVPPDLVSATLVET
ncbi:unnamed protein product [Brassica rapa]|uniref:Uncharacterized protein n=1 Tax=Brassica campestris TaxID=3711 RepID=A0A3P6CU82_BRACM|nr:unnamed protein product [Brassica rapa]VDD17158.1 unnamed protein product [Brassica rapa]